MNSSIRLAAPFGKMPCITGGRPRCAHPRSIASSDQPQLGTFEEHTRVHRRSNDESCTRTATRSLTAVLPMDTQLQAAQAASQSAAKSDTDILKGGKQKALLQFTLRLARAGPARHGRAGRNRKWPNAAGRFHASGVCVVHICLLLTRPTSGFCACGRPRSREPLPQLARAAGLALGRGQSGAMG